jgi:hypothetical protein
MAKYNVNHTCGHAETHALFGKSSERDRKISWLETTLCGECFAKKRETENAAAAIVAAEKNGAAGLPALTGSPKQIAWAETIRATALAAIEREEAQMLAGLPALTPEIREEVCDALALIASEPRGQSEARWWIDRREPGFAYFVSYELRHRIEFLCPQFSAWRDAKEVARGS